MIPETLVPDLRAYGEVREREPLSRHTTVGIGGPADLYVKVASVEALVRVLASARRAAVPWFVLGAGSNLLVGDGGIRGVVIEYDAKSVHGPETQPDGRARFTVEAGASFAVVARGLSRRGFAGLEWAVGIPGTLGGAVITNAGAYGGSLSDGLVSVRIVEPGCEPRELPADAFALSYRESALSRGVLRDIAILAVTIDLTPDDPAAVMARVAALDADRRAAQPAGQNTGSVFKNPPGHSAWRLIDAAGLRGHRIGAAVITEKHCNFFANTGGATAADFMALIDLARTRVRERFGVELEPEVWFVGEGIGLAALTPGPSPVATGEGSLTGGDPQHEPGNDRGEASASILRSDSSPPLPSRRERGPGGEGR